MAVVTVSGLDMPIGYSTSVLLIHPRIPAGEELAHRLNERGFSTSLVASTASALEIAGSHHYRTVALFADLWRGSGIADLTALRGARPHTWIVFASPNPPPDEVADSLRYLADALLIGPLCLDDLEARLLAFSMRPRPP